MEKIKGYVELFYGSPVWALTKRGTKVLAVTEDGQIQGERPEGAEAIPCTITYSPPTKRDK